MRLGRPKSALRTTSRQLSAARLREALAGLARQLQASRQKDTTQDYQPGRQPSQGQGLE